MTLGFIGLGNMGQGMARNLLATQPNLRVYDQNPEAVAALAEQGAVETSLKDMQACETLITMLPAGSQVAEVLSHLAEGPPKLFIDLSLIHI